MQPRKGSWLNEERLEWLRLEYPRQSIAETIVLFERRFGYRPTRNQIVGASARYRLGPTPEGRREGGPWRKGRAPHNKGKTGYPATRGSFQSGEAHWHWKGVPVGAESVHTQSRTGRQIPVVKTKKGWQRKARVVWERNHGRIPAGEVVLQLDQDPMNCDIENLVCVSRDVISHLNHFQAPGNHGAETGAVRARLAQLRAAIFRRRQEAGSDRESDGDAERA